LTEDSLYSQQTELLQRFNEACNRHDVDAMMGMMTEECIFENTFPAPDGTLYKGQPAVRQFWENFFHTSPHAHFDVEEMFVAGERCVQLWIYKWVDEEGAVGHVRGVDVFRFRSGLITEKLSYVKG
jgi:ketosteroid isomerase-like protein